jgi:hypothetical protein
MYRYVRPVCLLLPSTSWTLDLTEPGRIALATRDTVSDSSLCEQLGCIMPIRGVLAYCEKHMMRIAECNLGGPCDYVDKVSPSVHI